MKLSEIKTKAEILQSEGHRNTERIAELIVALVEHLEEDHRVLNNHARAINSRSGGMDSIFDMVFGNQR